MTEEQKNLFEGGEEQQVIPDSITLQGRVKRGRRPKAEVEVDKQERAIRAERKAFKRAERLAKKKAWRQAHERRTRNAQTKAERALRGPDGFIPRLGCYVCGGLSWVPVKITDVNGNPSVAFACLDCAQYFERVGA